MSRTSTKRCCVNAIGQKIFYDKETEACCDDKIIKTEDQFCCGGVPMQLKDRKLCCSPQGKSPQLQ